MISEQPVPQIVYRKRNMTDEISSPAFPPGRSEVAISTRTVENAEVVTVSGVVDAATAAEVTAALQQVFDAAPAAVVIDLSDVTFLASAGMTVLIKASEQAREQAGSAAGFAVVATGSATKRPLTLVGLDGELNLCETVDEALRRVS
ncbi:STAS domain-containing protein [Mycobacterium sp. ITM-2016-00317]|uniref:STAS domain-containing protein n=1 Tax=Mycobacterium sp. ITM-2016-00317 TaxID=2099694 RepID=UPI00287F41D7|nr:STAS domain-containing protein [Mycobacterium sp. ITM-2016-00317]WNG89752.1 STAS domain-containing protein [Mycobacterium sp. ITM-2016-00317]